MSRNPDPPPSDVLHKALAGEPSLAALAEASGVSLSSLTRFVDRERTGANRDRSLSLRSVDALCAALGLRLVQGRRPAWPKSAAPLGRPPKRGT